MQKKTLTLLNHGGVNIDASVWEAPNSQSVILYLHGGGLVFGDRDDLPSAYIEKFVQNNHTVVSLDYPLAPETKLDQILVTLKQSINELSVYYNLDNLTIMGRSAGSYLSYLLIRDGLKATTFIDLYGYYRISGSEFTMPAPFYTKFPQVAPMQVQELIQSQPVVSGTMNERYPIYISGRQFGTWLSMFLRSVNDADKYSVSADQLAKFPKTLLLHCIKDPDVPQTFSQEANKLIPNSELISIDKEVHDFDREVTEETLAYYDQIIAFIQNA